MEVVLYVQRGCGPCHEARAWLRARGVAFEERDVARHRAWLEELKAVGSRVTPTVVVRGRGRQAVVTGFHPGELAAALSDCADRPAAGARGPA